MIKYHNDLPLLYFKDEKISISPKPRQVLYSRQFCCPKDYEVALKDFVEKVEKGMDLSIYMSELVRTHHDNNDALLNDWGIYHFHLTRRFRSNGVACRSNYQIFACCDNSTMYLLQIYRHDTPHLYSLQELFHIVYDNWEYLLDALAEGELWEKISDEDREELRRNHCMALTEINGKIYFPRGEGYASDGSSVTAVMRRDSFVKKIRLLERVFQNKAGKIIENCQTYMGIEMNRNLKLKLLKIDAYSFTIIELTNLLIMHVELRGNSLKIIEHLINPVYFYHGHNQTLKYLDEVSIY